MPVLCDHSVLNLKNTPNQNHCYELELCPEISEKLKIIILKCSPILVASRASAILSERTGCACKPPVGILPSLSTPEAKEVTLETDEAGVAGSSWQANWNCDVDTVLDAGRPHQSWGFSSQAKC